MTMPEYERAKRMVPPIVPTPAPMRVLKAIEKIEPCTSRELAEHLDMKMSTVQGHLVSLYWMGQVERRAGLENYLIYRSLRSPWERNKR